MTLTFDLTTSEVNTLIAALMMNAIRYDGMKGYKAEADRYRQLENKFRDNCYDGEEGNAAIASVKINATF